MRTEFHHGLELIVAEPSQVRHATPLLFVHGAFGGAWLWQEHYLPYFAAQGWQACALSLSGHGNSQGREYLDTLALRHYVQDVHTATAALAQPPVLIGHSMGGMVVQKYLEDTAVPAVVLMASVPPSGLLATTTELFIKRPTLFAELNHTLAGGVPQLNTLREALFHQTIEADDLARYFQHMQPESLRVIWDMTFFDLPRIAKMHRPPMLILGAEHDMLVPAREVERTAQAYDEAVTIYPCMGHGMMLEQDWQLPAADIAAWLETLQLN